MKILIVQDWLRSGGTERQSVFLAGAFHAAGHDVTLLTFRPGGRLGSSVPPGVRHEMLQPFDLGLDWFAPGLVPRARRLNPDVVLCMGRMANCYAGALQARLPAAAVVATMRTGKSLPRLFHAGLQKVRHVVANSHEARATLIATYGAPAGNITVIHNSLVFPPDRPAGAGAALRQAQQAGEDTTVLLCVAMFRPEKNQRELIEIVSGLPANARFQLWLAGEGPARAGCEARVQALALGDRVRFLGFQRDPGALYAAGDIAVHASWSESLSNFLIEAQAHGLPAVAYAAQGIAECFVPGQTGWVIPRGDRDAFRTRVMQVAGEPRSARGARAAAARTFARERFDSARQVQAYLALFERLK